MKDGGRRQYERSFDELFLAKQTHVWELNQRVNINSP